MNIEKIKNWKRQGEVATLFTVATLVLMAAGTFLGAQQIVQNNILKLGSFAYNNTYRAHFYTGPTFQDKDTIPGQPNSGYTLIRGSLCFTGATIPSQLQRFWVHTPKDPNQGYPKKACDNTNADPKDDCIVYEGKTVEYIAPQTSRPYCDSPDVGKANWRAWDFTLKLQAPYTNALCSGLFVSSSSSFMFKDPIEMDMNSWHNFLKGKGVDCGPTPTVANTPVPTDKPVLTEFPTIKVPTARPTIDTRVSPGPFVTAIILPTDTQRCPDPKKPCPSITPVGDCRGDIRCSKANPCPVGYACLHAKNDPLQIGVCQSLNPKCNPSVTPTRAISQAPTNSPAQAKIRGEIVVNSCKKPDSVSTIICEKNNPARCIDTAGPVSFIGQDPVNPNKWIYSYEHLQAPGANGGMEPVVTNAFYENMQAFAQYTSTGLIREPGRVSFPAAQLGNIRANATIPTGQTEAVINYEVPQNNIVCPPVTPSSVPPTVNPSPMACNYEATAVVVDEATQLPIPLSQMGDLNKWGLANDKQPAKPTTLFKNYGEIINGERTSKYTFKTDRLTFRNSTPADPNALYNQGDKAQVNLYIDTNKWQIVGKTDCQGRGCPSSPEPVTGRNLDQYGSPTDGFNFDCNTKVTRYGWIVRKLPDGNPGQCVMRDNANADNCTPKNVRAKLKSTSRVEVSWDPVSSSCPFNTSNGDFYRIDLVNMTQNPNAVVKTCDRISKTKAECRVDKSYDNGNGDFIRGHNYVANVYAIKEIPGATDLCPGFNGIGSFNRPTRDNGGDENKPEPTGEPVGERMNTKQLDWLVNKSVGVCWGAWSHGDCRHGYNGTDDWAQSITDKRFDCLAPRNEKREVVVRLRNDSNTDSIDVMPKRDDCTACSAIDLKDKNGNPYQLSQCNAGPGVNTTYGDTSVTLKKGQCYMVDENLRTSTGNGVPCAQGDSGVKSSQPKNDDKPKPIDKPGNGGDKKTGFTVTGKLTYKLDDSLEGKKIDITDVNVKYRTDDVNGEFQTATIGDDGNNYTFTIDNVDDSFPTYYYVVETTYEVDGTEKQNTLRAYTLRTGYKTKGAWDQLITLNATGENGTKLNSLTLMNKVKYFINEGQEKYKIIIDIQEYNEKNELVPGSAQSVFEKLVANPNGISVRNTHIIENSKKGHHYWLTLSLADNNGMVIATGMPSGDGCNQIGNSGVKTGCHIYEAPGFNNYRDINWTVDSRRVRFPTKPAFNSIVSSISLRNNSSSAIKSVSIAACDSSNKCSSNTVPLQLAAGASTKFKPTFSVPTTTRRLSCVINYTNGTSKQCPQQLITSDGGLQFTITAQSNNTVQTSVVDPLKVADTNRDCKVTSADATGLRDLDGSGTVNASDTSLFFSFLGQNACK